MYRTHTCGQLTIADTGTEVELCGWVQKSRDLGGMTFIDLRDRYGITQLVFNMEINESLCLQARKLGREFVIRIKGKVEERESKNKHLPTGDIEIFVSSLDVLTSSELPPFTIEDNTDGGEELRMKYRYLDLRRSPLQNNLRLRHNLAKGIRNYLDNQGFLEIETPYLIKSTPEGARDFIVPSRIHEGEFYALPQSPQTFKQLLMVSGYDKYFQVVKCFRDEDLRADRQPEFTQIDCEMSFVERNDVLETFEGLVKYLFKEIKNIDLHNFPVMSYQEAMENYGSDKPDVRFEMKINDLTALAKGKGFNVFDGAEYIGGICAKNAGSYSRKQLDALTDFVRKPQIGAKGLVYVKQNEDGTFKSSVDKFFGANDFTQWFDQCNGSSGDLLLLISGDKAHSLHVLNELRLEMAKQLELIHQGEFKPLWVVDFPLLEWDGESNRYHAMHHPFTSPKDDDKSNMENSPCDILANAYDLVINGMEIGGGSIRIHDRKLQEKMFDLLGFTKEEAQEQFGFLMDAFTYGAPPHGGIALGFDRLCAIFGESESIRDFIAFPKNNAARDVMIDAPSHVDVVQLQELGIIKK